MKQLLYTILLFGMFFFSCDEERPDDFFDLGVLEDFQVGKEYLSKNKDLQFVITTISDSRCPSDVVCVWEGEAVVKISVEKPVLAEIELSTYDNLIDTVGNYSFEIADAQPYPVSTETIKPKDYNIVLKIMKLN